MIDYLEQALAQRAVLEAPDVGDRERRALAPAAVGTMGALGRGARGMDEISVLDRGMGETDGLSVLDLGAGRVDEPMAALSRGTDAVDETAALGRAGGAVVPGPVERARVGAADGFGVGTWERRAFGAGTLLERVRAAEWGARSALGERRAISVTIPETAGETGTWSVEELDGLVERDARRYDGGFALY